MSGERFVLLRWRDRRDAGPEDVVVHAVLDTREQLDARLQQIAEKNAPHKLRSVGTDVWKIGPSGDQGFFGEQAMYLKAVRK